MKKLMIGSALAALAGAAMAQVPAAPAVQPGAPMAAQQQAMADRVQTRDSVVARVRDHFARMDANRDGFVAGDEMTAMRGGRGDRMAQRGGRDGQRMGQRIGQGAMGNPAAAFDRLDANRDGMLSRDEFASARQLRGDRRVAANDGAAPRAEGKRGKRMNRMGGGMMGGRMMKMADANNDGRVSLQEAQDSALRRFDMMDSNRDGRITPDERKGMHMKLRGERAPRAG